MRFSLPFGLACDCDNNNNNEEEGQKSCLDGLNELHHIPEYYDWTTAHELFRRLIREVPWEKMSLDGFETLPERAYQYTSRKRKKRQIAVLEDLIRTLEEAHPTIRVDEVFCNLLRNGTDRIDWHQDHCQGRRTPPHVFVVSFGTTRTVQYRLYRKRKMDELTITEFPAKHGDMYYMSPAFGKAHEHRVPVMDVAAPRVSIAFFCKTV